MKKIYQILLAASAALLTLSAQAQVGVGTATPDASAQLDVTSNNKGVLIPRMSSSERTGINPAAEGLLVYQTDTPSGFYYRSGSQWVRLINSAESVPASAPSLYAGNSSGSIVPILLGGTTMSFPNNQVISNGFSVNSSNTIFTTTSAGRYQLSYQLQLTGSLLTSSRILVNGVPLPASIISPFISLNNYATSVIVDLPANSALEVQFFGILAAAPLSADGSNYFSIVKLQ